MHRRKETLNNIKYQCCQSPPQPPVLGFGWHTCHAYGAPSDYRMVIFGGSDSFKSQTSKHLSNDTYFLEGTFVKRLFQHRHKHTHKLCDKHIGALHDLMLTLSLSCVIPLPASPLSRAINSPMGGFVFKKVEAKGATPNKRCQHASAIIKNRYSVLPQAVPKGREL